MLAKPTHEEKKSLIALCQAEGPLHQCRQAQLQHCQRMSVSSASELCSLKVCNCSRALKLLHFYYQTCSNPSFRALPWDKHAPPALLCTRALAMISLIQPPKAKKRNQNHTGCDTEAQGNHHTIKIHCGNQHLHWWAWCTAMWVIFFSLYILALSISSVFQGEARWTVLSTLAQ